MNTIIAYRHAELLLDHPELWDSLAGGVPFRQAVWLQAWWQQFGDDANALFVTVLDEFDEVCGVLPLQRMEPKTAQYVGHRGWQTIAAGKICTDHVSVLARPEDRSMVATAIAEFLTENAKDPDLGWDRLVFDGVVGGDPGMQELLSELQRCGAAVQLTSRMSLWFTPCQVDWDTYLMSFSRQSRRKQREGLQQLGLSGKTLAKPTPTNPNPSQYTAPEPELAIRFAEDKNTVTEAVNKLILLHQRHWQSAGETGTYAGQGMDAFILNAALNALAAGRLFLPSVVRIDPVVGEEKIIASQLFFVGDDQRMYCYSTGVDYDYAALAPGKLLTLFVLKYAHDRGYSGVDFMRGDEEYKRRMKAEPLPLIAAEIWAPTYRGRLMRVLSNGIFCCKQFARVLRKRPLVQTPSIEVAFADHFRQFLPSPSTTSSLSWDADLSHAANENADDDSEPPVILSFMMAQQSVCDASLSSLET
jgi:CelD/BcsL family acetyltransferase involved in cellulose biosynthesis